jgi:acetyl-CoA carboxylase beta subunit/acetyl-CoA carboxylase alpha subunit
VITAPELLNLVFDAGTWRSWDGPVTDPPGLDPAYTAALAAARERTGLTESVLTGEGLVGGRRVAAIASEFGFLGGSVGVVAAGRLIAAIARATAEGLPLLGSPASGGARMQEGTAGFARLAGVVAALGRHTAAGLPYLVYLRHPTTGGVLASWGSLGQLTAAEPNATIGYHGPRVVTALTGAPLPPGIQRAEHLARHGLLDAVLPPAALATLTARFLDLCRPTPARTDPSSTPPEAIPDVPAAAVLASSRRVDRPGVVALLTAAGGRVVRLADPGPGLVLALARFGATPCVLLGQDRRGPALDPMGLAAAHRGLRLATELRLPLVTVVDSAGAELSVRAEEGGLSAQVARTAVELAALPVPTVCLLLGQGAGGPALAWLPADRVVAAQHAWLAPLPPEGAAAIVRGDAVELAAAQHIRAADLLAAGIVQRVVPERPDAAEEPLPFLRRVGDALAVELAGLSAVDPAARIAARARRLG